jgi:transcriptional regulator with XRE-family HTH domain
VWAAAVRNSVLSLNIRRARRRLRLTQEDAAHAAKMKTPTYARIERGDVYPNFYSLLKIAKAFKMPIAELVQGSDLD